MFYLECTTKLKKNYFENLDALLNILLKMQNIPIINNATLNIISEETKAIIEKMYKIKRSLCLENTDNNDDILVSGSHLIFNPTSKQFVHVEHLPESEISEMDCDVLSCLITSDHIISIGGWLFHDWEDNNGSPSKSI